jgi:hypothetical protein
MIASAGEHAVREDVAVPVEEEDVQATARDLASTVRMAFQVTSTHSGSSAGFSPS